MMLELVMESTFAVVDIYFVGKLGRSPSPPWASPKPICSCSIPSPAGLSTAVTAIVARRIGEKTAAAGDAAVQAIAIAVLLSLPFSLAGIFYAQELPGADGRG